jgi:hypothetical protein
MKKLFLIVLILLLACESDSSNLSKADYYIKITATDVFVDHNETATFLIYYENGDIITTKTIDEDETFTFEFEDDLEDVPNRIHLSMITYSVVTGHSRSNVITTYRGIKTGQDWVFRGSGQSDPDAGLVPSYEIKRINPDENMIHHFESNGTSSSITVDGSYRYGYSLSSRRFIQSDKLFASYSFNDGSKKYMIVDDITGDFTMDLSNLKTIDNKKTFSIPGTFTDIKFRLYTNLDPLSIRSFQVDYLFPNHIYDDTFDIFYSSDWPSDYHHSVYYYVNSNEYYRNSTDGLTQDTKLADASFTSAVDNDKNITFDVEGSASSIASIWSYTYRENFDSPLIYYTNYVYSEVKDQTYNLLELPESIASLYDIDVDQFSYFRGEINDDAGVDSYDEYINKIRAYDHYSDLVKKRRKYYRLPGN